MTVDKIIGIVVVSLLVGSLLADLVLATTWNRTYFTSGVPIFFGQIPVDSYHSNLPSQTLLEKKFHSDLISSLLFKEIDSSSYGFRNRHFQFTWIRTPDLMHGLLIFDKNNSQVIVIGFANWFTLAICLPFVGVPLWNIVDILVSGEPSDLLIPLVQIGFIILFMGFLYMFQASRFASVATFAAKSWARKYMRENDKA